MSFADLFPPRIAETLRGKSPGWLLENRAHVVQMAEQSGADVPALREAIRIELASSAPLRPSEIVGDADAALLLIPDHPHWAGPARAQCYQRVLESVGIKVRVEKTAPRIAERVKGFRFIWNHALATDIGSLDRLADRQPETRIIHVNHSSLAFLSNTPGAWSKYIRACESARQRPNVWSVTQDKNGVGVAMGCSRVRQLSMPVPTFSPRDFRSVGNPVKVVIAGRNCITKNHLNSIVAVGLLDMPVHLHVCVPRDANLARMLELLGIDHTYHGLLEHERWIRLLRTEADVVLQPSLTESFNVVAAEAQQTGVPVIASPSVYTADPLLIPRELNDPQTIAGRIRGTLATYETSCTRAVEIASERVARRNSQYLNFVNPE